MEKTICPACKKEHIEQLDICNNCSFPFNGTEKEKAIHIGRFINKKGVLTDSSDSIKKSQLILFAIAGFNALFLIAGLFNGNLLPIDIILNTIVTLTFLLCGFFIYKKPVLLTVIPLILIIGINILNYFIEPSSIFRGIIIKLIIIGSLIYSIYLIKSAENFKKEYGVD